MTVTYAQIALAVLKFINFLLSRAHEKGLISEGEDRAIARETAAILAKSKFAKEIMAQVSSLTETQTDDVLKQLGAS